MLPSGSSPLRGGDVLSRNAVIAALALAVVFGAWEILFAAFMADDLLQLGVLERISPSAAWTSVFDLYTISDGNPAHVLKMKDAGIFPWSFDPAFEMGFFRPLSSALLTLDHTLFGLHPRGYRLHGVLWSLTLVYAVALIFRRTLPNRVGGLALIVFAVAGIQAMFCWNATRHVVVAAALGLLAFAAHLHWRVDGWRPGFVLSLLGLGASLLASEVGIAVALYLLTYEILYARDSVSVRLRALAPVVAVQLVYLILWHSLGHGASAGTGYIDPLRNPGAFIGELPMRLSVLIGGVVAGGTGTDLWVLRPELRSTLAVIMAALSIGFALLLAAAWKDRVADERRVLRWLTMATLASAVPFAGTPIGTRCLLVPFVGGAVLIATVIDQWWSAWRFGSQRALKIAGAVVAVVHLIGAPLGRLTTPPLLRAMLVDRAAATVRDAELEQSTLATTHVVVLSAPDLIVGLHGGLYPRFHGLPHPASWYVLSWAGGTHRYTRMERNTLDLQIEGGGIESSNLQPGTVIKMRDLEATVVAVGKLGPTHVRIRLERSLDDPSLALLAWRDGRLRRVAAPAVGEAIVLRR